jgi:GntR family transcriptional repressor for pyruvate dehydrogenase complex
MGVNVAMNSFAPSHPVYRFDEFRSIYPGFTEEMLMYKAVHASRLFEQIVQQIEDSIREGRLKPGEQLLAERELALQFGVSRTAVREAVKTLS